MVRDKTGKHEPAEPWSIKNQKANKQSPKFIYLFLKDLASIKLIFWYLMDHFMLFKHL